MECYLLPYKRPTVIGETFSSTPLPLGRKPIKLGTYYCTWLKYCTKYGTVSPKNSFSPYWSILIKFPDSFNSHSFSNICERNIYRERRWLNLCNSEHIAQLKIYSQISALPPAMQQTLTQCITCNWLAFHDHDGHWT